MEVSKAIGMKMLITVPAFDVKDKSVSEIKEEAVERLRYLSDKVGEDIKISLEFCGAPNCSINQFGTAYDIVKTVDRSNVGITVDTFHFHEMCSKLEDLKAADGNKIFAIKDCPLHSNAVASLNPIFIFIFIPFALLKAQNVIKNVGLLQLSFYNCFHRHIQYTCFSLFLMSLMEWMSSTILFQPSPPFCVYVFVLFSF